MATTSILDNIRIASPCAADWDSMSGDQRNRFCGQCNRHVYNFSSMSEAEVLETVRQHEGRLCARFYLRPDGKMLTADCPVGRQRVRHKRFVGISLGAMGVMLAGFTAPAAIQKIKSVFHRHSPVPMGGIAIAGQISCGPAIMGDVAVPTPPPAPPPTSTQPAVSTVDDTD